MWRILHADKGDSSEERLLLKNKRWIMASLKSHRTQKTEDPAENRLTNEAVASGIVR